MADFLAAVKKTLQHEGGYVNNPADSGGATNMGITQKDMPQIDIKTLTEDQAITYYQQHYWKTGYSSINSQALAEKLFDLGVLFGVGVAVKELQEVLRITPDGFFGAETLAAVNQVEPTAEGLLVTDYKNQMQKRTQQIIQYRPSEIVFLKGWTNRIES